VEKKNTPSCKLPASSYWVFFMNRKRFQLATVLMWLALPLTALRYWQVWNRLPARMATHFAANGQPNGWMTREASLYFVLGLLTFLLLIFTAILYLALKHDNPLAFDAALLAFFYFIIGVIFYGNHSVIEYNLTGRPVTLTPVLLGVPVAVVVLLLLYLRFRRGDPLPTEAPLAEEVHSSPLWALVFGAFAVLYFSLMASVSALGARVALFLMGTLFLLITAHAWSGFHYWFTPAGVEIRTLGFRLRSIPVGQICSYRIERWNPLRGYGIRGIGRTRAYVWCNRVVHITTQEGEVFLGHNDPARIVRDLDMLRQFSPEAQGAGAR
jgi:Protein of unknown function (DUF1648)